MSYKPLTDDELNDSKPGPKGMLPRDLGFLDYLAALEEQSRRANAVMAAFDMWQSSHARPIKPLQDAIAAYRGEP